MSAAIYRPAKPSHRPKPSESSARRLLRGPKYAIAGLVCPLMVLRPAAWPLLWSGGLAVMIRSVAQAQEMLLRMAEDGAPLQKALFLGITVILMGTLWYAARASLYVLHDLQRGGLRQCQEQLGPRAYDRMCEVLRAWAPRLAATLPALATASVLLRDADAAAGRLGTILLALAATFVALTWARGRIIDTAAGSADQADAAPEERFTDVAIERFHRELGQRADQLPRGTLAVLWFGVMATVALTRLFAKDGVALGQTLGTASIVFLAAACSVAVGTVTIHLVRQAWYLSLTILLLLLVVAAGWFASEGWTDNHAVRQLGPLAAPAERARVAQRPTLQEHLARWLALRFDASQDPARPYPLIVAAAQGGGIRAALWTAATLGAMQERDPRFACHLFAISGVSGGAVGAAVFASQLPRELPCRDEEGRPTPAWSLPPGSAASGEGHQMDAPACRSSARSPSMVERSRCILGRDFLGPVAAGLFFPDLLQRFLPTGGLLGDAWLLPDRQSFLERAWEEAYADELGAEGAGPLAQGFVQAVRPDKEDASRPALFLVASEVEMGRRWIASDTRVEKDIFVDAVDTLTGRELDQESGRRCDGDTCLALPLSAAAGLSARFPYVSPPGMLTFTTSEGEPARRHHLLDGGIVESSGAATAAEILQAIRGWCEPEPGKADMGGTLACRFGRSKEDGSLRLVPSDGSGKQPTVWIRPAVVQLTNDSWAPPAVRGPDPGDLNQSWFPELLDPVKALFASRTGRGRAAHDRLAGDEQLMAGRDDLDANLVLAPDTQTDGSKVKAPLGWVLRARTAEHMVGDAARALGEEKFLAWQCKVLGPGPGGQLASSFRLEDASGLEGPWKWTLEGSEPIGVSRDRPAEERQWTVCIDGKSESPLKATLTFRPDFSGAPTVRVRLVMSGAADAACATLVGRRAPGCPLRGENHVESCQAGRVSLGPTVVTVLLQLEASKPEDDEKGAPEEGNEYDTVIMNNLQLTLEPLTPSHEADGKDPQEVCKNPTRS